MALEVRYLGREIAKWRASSAADRLPPYNQIFDRLTEFSQKYDQPNRNSHSVHCLYLSPAICSLNLYACIRNVQRKTYDIADAIKQTASKAEVAAK